jgi:hypothetical protein
MGKRSNFNRNPRDFYPTPRQAVEPLIDHLPYDDFDYVEPCAGDGRLVNHISELTEGQANCVFMSDIEPQVDAIYTANALEIYFEQEMADMCITNPPWERKFLHNFLDHWLDIMPTWILLDADWMHTKQSAVYMTYCKKVVSIGRVKWIEGSKHSGKDNCCWYLFDASKGVTPTEFYGRLI